MEIRGGIIIPSPIFVKQWHRYEWCRWFALTERVVVCFILCAIPLTHFSAPPVGQDKKPPKCHSEDGRRMIYFKTLTGLVCLSTWFIGWSGHLKWLPVSKHIQNTYWEKLFIGKTFGFSDDDDNKKSCIQMWYQQMAPTNWELFYFYFFHKNAIKMLHNSRNLIMKAFFLKTHHKRQALTLKKTLYMLNEM